MQQENVLSGAQDIKYLVLRRQSGPRLVSSTHRSNKTGYYTWIIFLKTPSIKILLHYTLTVVAYIKTTSVKKIHINEVICGKIVQWKSWKSAIIVTRAYINRDRAETPVCMLPYLMPEWWYWKPFQGIKIPTNHKVGVVLWRHLATRANNMYSKIHFSVLVYFRKR